MTDPSVFATRRLLAAVETALSPLCATGSGKTLGIVGFGPIGREVAERAHRRFGMSIVIFDPRPVPNETLAAMNARQVDSLDALLPLCDVVSLHCDDERQVMTATRLGLMKEDACLINASHRNAIDEQALAQALWFETIGGAVLCGFDRAARIHPDLCDCDNLVIMPLVESQAGGMAEDRVAPLPAATFGGYTPCERVA